MATIGKIAIIMAANTSPLQAGLAKASSAVSRWERDSSRSLGRSRRLFVDGFGEFRDAAQRITPQTKEIREGLGKMARAAGQAIKPLAYLATINLARWGMAGVSAITSLAGSLLKVVGILGGVTAGAALAVTWVGVKLAKAAIHFQETVSLTKTVFGDQADAVIADAERMARAIGISRKEYLDSATTLNEIFSGAGIANKDATDLARSMTGLAADMSAFRDMDFAEAFGKISDAMRGSGEVLRAYGVDLSTTAVKEEAVRLGLIKKGRDVDAVSTKLATASLIQRGLAKDAGELGRAFDSPRNQLAALAGRWEDLKIAVGEKLIPKLKPALDWLNGAIVVLGDNLDKLWDVAADAFKRAKDKVFEFGSSVVGAFAGGRPIVQAFAETIADLVDGLDRVKATILFMKAHVDAGIGVATDLFRTTPYTPEEWANKGAGFDGALDAIDNLGKAGDKVREAGKRLGQIDISKAVNDAVAAAKEAVEKAQTEIAQAAEEEAAKPRDWKQIANDAKKDAEDKTKSRSPFSSALTLASAGAASAVLRSRYGLDSNNPVARNTKETAVGVKQVVGELKRLGKRGPQLAVADF